MSQGKEQAKAFLDELALAIARQCPKGTAMERAVRRIIREARKEPPKKHLGGPEAAFLNHFVVPVLFEQIKLFANLTDPRAREALLNEYHRSMPDYSAKSPIRAGKHPFNKAIGSTPDSVYSAWLKADKGPTQSCPDFALIDPFPHHIVFEGKYFPSGTLKYAQRELVKNIYQAFFYRGLAQLDATKKGHPEWNYDYACLLAFDASPGGTLKSAWANLSRVTRESFWGGANIYVMILGGEGEIPDN
jgi:hypothetical protein